VPRQTVYFAGRCQYRPGPFAAQSLEKKILIEKDSKELEKTKLKKDYIIWKSLKKALTENMDFLFGTYKSKGKKEPEKALKLEAKAKNPSLAQLLGLVFFIQTRRRIKNL
jgi:hypothetical protein